MAEKKNKPDCRFKGFDDEWKECKLEALASFSKGQGYSKSDLVKEGTPIILYGRLYTKYQTVISDVDTMAIAKVGSIYSTGQEVVVPASGETAEDIARASAIVTKNILIGGDLNIIYPNDQIDSIFLALNISNGKEQKELIKRAQGKSVVHIRNSDLKNVNLCYPNKNEQSQIAAYFQKIDKLISLHQNKYNKLAILIKAMLEKMFPKNGVDVPEIRFKGFDGAWGEKSFKDMCWFQEGPGLRNWQFTTHGIKVINITNLENGFLNLERTDRHISLKEFSKMYKHFEIDENDIVVASSGNSYGKVAVVRKQDLPLLMNTSVIRFKPLNGLDYNYLHNFLKSNQFKNQIDLLITGGAQPNFGPVHVNKVQINLPPTIDEQIKIGAFFQNLYNLISLYERELEKLKNMKKACLDKMFV